jgi:SAM-dependent methyltransferase
MSNSAASLDDYLTAISQLISGTRTQSEQSIAAGRWHEVGDYLDIHRPLRVLDLANSKLQPQYLLLQAEGHQVYGIDLANRPGFGWEMHGYRLARWLYSRHIHPDPARRPKRLVCGDVSYIPFIDNYFDLVTSVAAFEHFLDVPAVVAEMYRVMRPGGIAYIWIHLFTSPSGGHNLKLMEVPMRRVPVGVDAWDHLRKRRLPFTVPLNEWRIQRYLDEFSRHFEILKHFCAMHEGENFLTPEIQAELADFSTDELTAGS